MAASNVHQRTTDHASLEEVALAVAALTDADLVRLGLSARLRARGLVQVEWRDLLHDAIQRALDGTRRWPPSLPFAFFLREVIRSLASEAWRVQAAERSRHVEGSAELHLANLPNQGGNPEQAAVARDLASSLKRLFDGDRAALGILAGLTEGLSPAEIQARLEIGQTDYDSARRRIRRRIAAAPEMFL